MSLTISLIALSVSLLTLWLTQLRRGRLEVAPPKHWAGRVSDDVLTLLLPLAIGNTGTRTVVVHDLRLCFLDEPDQPLEFVRTRSELRPERAGDPSFASPFAIDPGAVVVRFCEFERRPGRAPEAGSWPIRLEAQAGNRPREWRTLLTFGWGVTPNGVRNLHAFIAHRNAAADQ